MIEYRGAAIRALDMEGRMTVCNMSIEAGVRAGMIAPDETTIAWLTGRELAPMITWGTNPGMAIPIDGHVPHVDANTDSATTRAYAYMGLTPGQRLLGQPVDVVFLGSCTNGRLDDLRCGQCAQGTSSRREYAHAGRSRFAARETRSRA